MNYGFLLLMWGCVASAEIETAENVCLTNEECAVDFNSFYKCESNTCVHEDILPLDIAKGAGLLISVIFSAFINAGGTGGNALLIPIYINAFGFVIKEAVPLTKAVLFGASFVSFFVNITKRNAKNPNQPLVDHQVTSYVLSLALAGTAVGVLLLRVLPSEVVLLWMLCYMIYFSHYIVMRAWNYHKKESLEIKQQKGAQNFLQTQAVELKTQNDPQSLEAVEAGPSAVTQAEKRISTLKMLQPHFKFILLSLCSFLVILTMALLQGGRGFTSVIGIERGSAASRAIFFAGEVINVGIGLCLGFSAARKFNDVRRAAQGKVEAAAPAAAQESLGSKAAIEVLTRSFKIFCSGVISSSVGVGGGIIVSLFLLDSGYSPQESAAICASVMMYTTLSSATQFFIAGFFSLKNAFILGFFTMLGSYLGNILLDRIVKRYKRQGILLWIVAAITILSTVVMVALGISELLVRHRIFEAGGSY